MSAKASVAAMPRRDIAFDIVGSADPDWFEGDPRRSAFCDALSVFFPVGERFFIAALRGYAKRIDDPALKAEIRAFCAQEAMHTREHEAYNDALRGLGYDVDRMEARAAKELARPKSALGRLLTTTAIEHLTATFAYFLLNNPEFLSRVPRAYRDLWTWHCVEELEHKSVAFDVFLSATAAKSPLRRYLHRCAMLIVVTVSLNRVLIANANEILRSRGHVRGVRHWAGLLWFLFGRPGVYRLTVGHYLRFYLPGFHPSKVGEVGDLAGWRTYFDQRAGEAS